MSRSIPFEINETYHVYNRGIEKRVTFESEPDYIRMMLLLLVANSSHPVTIRNLLRNYQGRTLVQLAKIFKEEVPEDKIVDVLAYCLMPNHIHLVLSQRVEGGISKYLQKVLTAYTMYFNKKYERTGVLFQGTTKSQHIDDESQYLHIFDYVHKNPISLIQSDWKEKGVRDKKKVLTFLEEYQYGSYRDFTNEKSVTRSILALNEIENLDNIKLRL
ncbi:hypothetical protein CL644_01995 [bacterium]|nr:hypothetical protein [Parcubacteria group bacterium]MBF05455.1 hypothetical protein [bacterium]|tara:strand:- start:4756 stop:5403 length:648 start_codon:yes stop_codon:yes gene_type:complete